MSLLEETLPASYAGVQFPVLTASLTGGQKDVLKEFPNSNRQKVEQLGVRGDTFTLDAVIRADANGENYLQRRRQLLNVLKGGGENKLVHPLEGTLESIVARSWSVVEKFNNLGDGKISIVFAPSDTSGQPIVESTSLTDISNATSNTRVSLETDFTNRYTVPTTGVNFDAAVEKVQSVVDGFKNNITFLSVSANTIDEFTAQLSELETDIFRLVSSPQELSNSITTLFTTTSNLYNTPDAAFDVLKKFFEFGENDSGVNQTTATRKEREKNRKALNALVNINALSLAYARSSEVEYSTVNQVDTAANDLETQYQTVVVNNSQDINTIFAEDNGASIETINLLTDTRSTVQGFFDEEKITAKRIIEVRTPVLPARVLAYQYYGDSTSGEDIAALNDEINVSFMSGNVEIFTA